LVLKAKLAARSETKKSLDAVLVPPESPRADAPESEDTSDPSSAKKAALKAKLAARSETKKNLAAAAETEENGEGIEKQRTVFAVQILSKFLFQVVAEEEAGENKATDRKALLAKLKSRNNNKTFDDEEQTGGGDADAKKAALKGLCCVFVFVLF
jgi:hypothetical protein